jgi:hypothetical protein
MTISSVKNQTNSQKIEECVILFLKSLNLQIAINLNYKTAFILLKIIAKMYLDSQNKLFILQQVQYYILIKIILMIQPME